MRHASFTLSARAVEKRAAFTLIELLTVIAIIGVLAAIIIPVVGAVRRTAQASACTSNLRQIGTAMILHAQENKDELPIAIATGGGWRENMWQSRLQPYLENKKPADFAGEVDSVFAGVFRCPGKPNYDINGPTDREKLSYGMNAFGDGMNTAKVRKLRSLAQPTITMLATDSNEGYCAVRNANYLYDNVESVALWHGQKNNTVFADGHVEAVPKHGLNYYLVKSTDNELRP